MVVLRHLFEMERGAEGIDERTLSNRDVYIGNFRGALPHGKGKYAWLDGTVYEGDWEEGKMTGRGQIIWSSGAKYEGDFSGGYLHGTGTFTGLDGTEYAGAWRMNIQHGLGRKLYSNKDAYEGSWKEGVHDGSGTYCWSNGNTYAGNWKSGKTCGRGVMKWANGDVYDGFWLNGLRNGSGVYKFSDGGHYFGTWSMGIKDGKGTFYPAGTKQPSLRRWSSSLGFDEKGKSSFSHSFSLREDRFPTQPVRRSMSIGGSLGSSGHISHRSNSLDGNGSSSNSRGEFIRREPSILFFHASDDEEEENESQDNPVYEREYVQGVLTKERVTNTEPSRKTKQRSKCDLKEARKRSLVDIFESRRSYYLMLNLQLGIRYTVGKITPVPMREVRASDFGDQARIIMCFPRRGSQFTPPHYSLDFYWKDYCPMVFRNLREMFKLDAAEYMMSICGDDGLSEISSPGKSGSIFYLSLDGRFFIKTLKKTELKCILKMLPQYYNHVKQHENTLITKFFGIHRITLRGRRKVRFVVMGNMLRTELKIHHRYDLKGSTLGRFTDKNKIKENTTLKDLDLGYEFRMDKSLRKSLLKQLSLDCSFLESQQIIDYSLLLGLHFRAPDEMKAVFRLPGTTFGDNNLPADDGVNSREELLIPPKSSLLAIHEPKSVSTAPGTHIRGSNLRAYSLGGKEVDLILPGTGRLPVQLGVNMPAQARHKVPPNEADSSEMELFEVFDVVLYMGIIDILQEYNMKKKVEHAYKSLKFDHQSMSVVDPKLYARRFLSFLEKIFIEEP